MISQKKKYSFLVDYKNLCAKYNLTIVADWDGLMTVQEPTYPDKPEGLQMWQERRRLSEFYSYCEVCGYRHIKCKCNE